MISEFAVTREESLCFPSIPSGELQVTTSHLAGHLVFSELARATGNQKYTELARAAADLGFDQQGRPRESMPFHHEMSDSVFMGTPILAETGRLTGERKYFDMAIRHWRFVQQLDQRSDGLYRNSPLNEAAWGRGNGFPALGLALSLTALPENHPGRAEMLAAYRVHMRALLRHQDPTGMWHQVIDHPESYRELTATAMIAVAMMRGLRRGWLERQKYEAATGRAWYALKSRIAPSGELVDCLHRHRQTDQPASLLRPHGHSGSRPARRGDGSAGFGRAGRLGTRWQVKQTTASAAGTGRGPFRAGVTREVIQA